VICAPHIEQKGTFAFTAEPHCGQLVGALAGAVCAVAAVRGVPQCIQNGEFPFPSPPQWGQRDTPGPVGLPDAGADEYWV